MIATFCKNVSTTSPGGDYIEWHTGTWESQSHQRNTTPLGTYQVQQKRSRALHMGPPTILHLYLRESDMV